MGTKWFYFDILIGKNANSASTVLIPDTVKVESVCCNEFFNSVYVIALQ